MVTVGRNDMCPCGSGKKYKHCCMNKSIPHEQSISYYQTIYIKQTEVVYQSSRTTSLRKRESLCREIVRIGSNAMDSLQFSNVSNDLVICSLATGIYANMGGALCGFDRDCIEEGVPSNDEDLIEAKDYLGKALLYKKTNLFAASHKFYCHMRLQEFQDALDTITDFEVPDYDTNQKSEISELLRFSITNAINTIDMRTILPHDIFPNIIKAYFEIEKKLKLKPLFKIKFDMYFYLLPLYYQSIGDMSGLLTSAEEAYNIYQKNDGLRNNEREAQILSIMAFAIRTDPATYKGVEQPIIRKRLERALHYHERVRSISNWDKLPDAKMRMSRYVEYASVLTALEQYDEAEKILSKMVKEYPSDQTFYSYADCLYKHGKKEEALLWARKALFVVEEQVNLRLNAQICKDLQKYDEAASLYEKLISFLEDDPYKTITYTDDDGSRVHSVVSKGGEFIDGTVLDTYHDLLIILQKAENFQDARIYLTLAEEKFPKDSRWEIWESVLPALVISRQQLNETKQALEKNRQEYLAHKNTVREWALRLIQLQDNSTDLDMDKDSDWNTFEKEIDQIILELKEQSKQNRKIYSETESRIKKEFPNLTRNASDFLITAETLFQQHQSSEIDFAAIVVEYCKVLETQLRFLLGDILPSNVKMLGNIIGCIAEKGISPYNRYYEQFAKINEYRHSSAHTGKLRKNDAEEIRKIYFDLGLLRQLK